MCVSENARVSHFQICNKWSCALDWQMSVYSMVLAPGADLSSYVRLFVFLVNAIERVVVYKRMCV